MRFFGIASRIAHARTHGFVNLSYLPIPCVRARAGEHGTHSRRRRHQSECSLHRVRRAGALIDRLMSVLAHLRAKTALAPPPSPPLERALLNARTHARTCSESIHTHTSASVRTRVHANLLENLYGDKLVATRRALLVGCVVVFRRVCMHFGWLACANSHSIFLAQRTHAGAHAREH